jgi:hypothetical protein
MQRAVRGLGPMTYFVKNHYHSTVWVLDLDAASAFFARAFGLRK